MSLPDSTRSEDAPLPLDAWRNTVLNRLRRVESLTQRSLERVDHLVEWSLALLARAVLATDPTR